LSRTVLRELADISTYDWLEKVRKEVVSGTVVKVDQRVLVLRLDGGAEFAFRYSDKSKVTVQGAPAITDLKEGQRLYVKGRLLPTLDTWIVSASDQKPEPAATKSKKSKEPATERAKPIKIGASGTLKGTVDLHRPTYQMVDLMVEGHLIHAIYNAKTTIRLDGQKSDLSAIARGLKIEITYRRDQYGRLIASKIELFHSSAA
jgi:hypothetical protein